MFLDVIHDCSAYTWKFTQLFRFTFKVALEELNPILGGGLFKGLFCSGRKVKLFSLS